MRAATAAVLRVMSTHIVNWLLPENDWEQLLTALLGTPGRALECMSALQLPDEPGHILAAPRRDEAASTTITGERGNAVLLRAGWLSAAMEAAAGDPAMAGQLTAISIVLQWAATSEERRKSSASATLPSPARGPPPPGDRTAPSP